MRLKWRWRDALAVGSGLAVLLALLAPLTVRYRENERGRALRDSRTLGRAILAFHLDTGIWPVHESSDTSTGKFSRLVGLPADRIAAANPSLGAEDGDAWGSGRDGGLAGAIEDQLIRNRGNRRDPIYAPSATAPDPPGWNGPYLTSVPLDPWDRSYVCNTRYLEDAQVPGVTRAESAAHAVFCLSAGPNGTFETPFDDAVPISAPAGDDIGWAIQAGESS